MVKDKITFSEVKNMGFSEKLIRDLLPEPELARNPKYKCAAPMKLYLIADVQKAMKNELFIAYQVKRQKRKEAAKQAVETKRKKIISEMQSFSDKITVKRIDIDTLLGLTLRAKQDHYDWMFELYNNDYCNDAYSADESTRERWMVNYIRHNLTEYEDGLDNLYGRTGKDDAYHMLYQAVMEKIALVYPELADECKNQILTHF